MARKITRITSDTITVKRWSNAPQKIKKTVKCPICYAGLQKSPLERGIELCDSCDHEFYRDKGDFTLIEEKNEPEYFFLLTSPKWEW